MSESEETTPIPDTFSEAPKSCRETVVVGNLRRLNGRPPLGAGRTRSIDPGILGAHGAYSMTDEKCPAGATGDERTCVTGILIAAASFEPFVIGAMGTGVTKEGADKNAVSVAQREAAAAPEFKDNVACVESYPFYAVDAAEMWWDGTWGKRLVEFSQIASDRPYHYMGSGKFFVRLGDALATATLATAMCELMEEQK